MANTSKEVPEHLKFYNLKRFPSVIDKRIHVKIFLEATSDLLVIIDQLGSVFAPVKYDMQGNIDKIEKFFTCKEDSCLLELMLDEKSKGKHEGAEGVLWLNRALFFFELVFQEIIECLNRKEYEASINKIFTIAYNSSVKKYHNWVTQKIFFLILKMSPTLPQILTALDPSQDMERIKSNLIELHSSLNAVRSLIDMFFEDNNLFIETK